MASAMAVAVFGRSIVNGVLPAVRLRLTNKNFKHCNNREIFNANLYESRRNSSSGSEEWVTGTLTTVGPDSVEQASPMVSWSENAVGGPGGFADLGRDSGRIIGGGRIKRGVELKE